ncbi:MAG: hypothetical protein MZV65_22070 [Chromatiales bacterium]|nr:hypothetical protein [Chromatiales bacterium]
MREQAGRLFFLLNKCDLLDERERAESLAFTERALAAAVGRTVQVFAVSARWALEAGRRSGSGAARRQRLSSLHRVPGAVPGCRQGPGRLWRAPWPRPWAGASARHGWRPNWRARRAAHAGGPVAPRRFAAFESRRRTLEQDRRDVLILLKAEVGQLAGETVTSAVTAFAADPDPAVSRVISTGTSRRSEIFPCGPWTPNSRAGPSRWRA